MSILVSLSPSFPPSGNMISRVTSPTWGAATTPVEGLQANVPLEGASYVAAGRSRVSSIDLMPLTPEQRQAYQGFTQSLETTQGRIGEYRNGFISAWLLQLLSSIGSAWEQYYDQLLCDPIVESNLHLRATAVCADDFCWVEGVEKDHRLYEIAKEVRDFVEYNFQVMGYDKIHQPVSVGFGNFHRLLYQLARIADVGYRVAEITYKPPVNTGDRWKTLQGHGVQFINSIEIKEHWATALITDRRKRVLGIMDRTYWAGLQIPVLTYDMYGQLIGGVYWLGHPHYPAWSLQYVVHSWSPIDNDPLGNPLMRQIFSSWWARQIVENQKLRFSEEAVFPVVVGRTPQGATKICDADGNEIDPVNQMAMVLANGISRGDRVFVFPFGSETEQLPPIAAAKELVEIGHTFEANIRAVALGSPLQTGVAQFQTQNTTTAQSNWTNVVLRGHQLWLQGAVGEYAYRLVALNYGGLVDPLDLPLIIPRLKLDNVRSRAEFLQIAQGAKHMADAGLMVGEEQANFVLESMDAPLVDEFVPIQQMQADIEREKIAASKEAARMGAQAQKEAASKQEKNNNAGNSTSQVRPK